MSKETKKLSAWCIPATLTVCGYTLSVGETLEVALDNLNMMKSKGIDGGFTMKRPKEISGCETHVFIEVDPYLTEVATDHLDKSFVTRLPVETIN
jgi:hypothetical protein